MKDNHRSTCPVGYSTPLEGQGRRTKLIKTFTPRRSPVCKERKGAGEKKKKKKKKTKTKQK
jgi:hypothetical protein